MFTPLGMERYTMRDRLHGDSRCVTIQIQATGDLESDTAVEVVGLSGADTVVADGGRAVIVMLT